MQPLERPLADSEITELLGVVRRATRNALVALGRLEPSEPRQGDLAPRFLAAGLEPIGAELFRRAAPTAEGPPVYLAHSEADQDAAIIRPLAWHDAVADEDLPRRLLFETAALPTGGYALDTADAVDAEEDGDEDTSATAKQEEAASPRTP